MPKRKAVDVEADVADEVTLISTNPDPMSILRTPLNKTYLSLDKCIKIVSWNVAGIRGTLKNKPTIFSDLVEVIVSRGWRCYI